MPAATDPVEAGGGLSRKAFALYLLFMCSWLLHLPARVPGMESLRADLLLVGLLVPMGLSLSRHVVDAGDPRIKRALWTLVAYCLLTVPFVEWPGSVLSQGFPNFFKAFVFYWFTTLFVTSPRRLKILLIVFAGCQAFRCIEPLYLHYTQGYWGSSASMANWESMDRLAGSPYDVVNPNGLAFIVLTVIPFLHYGTTGSKWGRVLYLLLLPALVQTLLLTGSRSGLLGLAAIFLLVWIKARRKILMAAVVVAAAVAAVPYLTADQLDRYLSIFDSNTKNAVTADERYTVVVADYGVAMRRPIFGHGLGTSREANANFGVHDQPSHNLYVEILEELGFCGLFIFLGFMGSVIAGVRRAGALIRSTPSAPLVLRQLVPALYVWLGMNLFFSWASFGLSGYEWYLTAGLVDVALRLTSQVAQPYVTSAAALSSGGSRPYEFESPARTFVSSAADY